MRNHYNNIIDNLLNNLFIKQSIVAKIKKKIFNLN